ncbi:PREDICTED: uncharacterized protein LOC108756743 [Trachymyrmex septentrionalis]|uniref:uncharacterized protein LOC108756743 n=1 Tax=Trachymyrmex septentrionalis TaxID=34720 RepID=UPI00084EDAD5|nr:PREDICTED: uncharacterized protein LOC108756743 [Trachymyrmex septentrionalis]
MHDRPYLRGREGDELSALGKARIETCIRALSRCLCFGGYGGTETPPLPPPPTRSSRGSMVKKERGRACGSGCSVFLGRRATEKLRRFREENSINFRKSRTKLTNRRGY